ncbi:MAG TPA: hypothetical protein VD763_03125, partial [Candidatus Saccharimonadales bacterium]|nr:hypothetical protein [Candidatus Saccharimonadales bacterium]
MTDGTPPTEPQQPIEPASDVHSPPDVPTEPVEPTPGPDVRSDIPRQVALGAVVFIATLLLLVGATAIVRPAPASTPGGTASAMAPATTAPAASSTPSLAASPDASPQASTSMGPAPSPSVAGSDGPGSPSAVPPIAPQPTAATLVGAGDIADCGTDGDEATAALLDALPGTVFTAGDNAYPSGSEESFRDCYDPSWGRHKARTRPAAGNHDWETGRATGYLGYFGDAATGPDGATWYSYELGTWHIIVLDS